MSMFKQLVKLRDSLSEQLNSNIDALNYIAGASSLPSNNIIPISGDRTLKITQGRLTLFNDLNDEIDHVDFSDITDLNKYISNSDEKWVDMVDELGRGSNTYQLLSELTSRYSYCNRLSFSDITSYVDTYDVSDKTTMINGLFSASDANGYVTRNSFLELLQQWVSRGKESTDAESYDVDTTNPYGLEAITTIVVTAVSTAISIVCTVLSGIFGVFLAILGGILSTLFNSYSAIRSYSYLRVDPDSSNNYVKGPIVCDEDFSNFSAYSYDLPHVWLRESNGIAIFSWPKDFKNGTGSRKWNAYLYPCWRGYDTLKWLIGENALTWDSVNEQVRYTHIDWIARMWEHPIRSSLKYGEESLNSLQVGASLLVGFMVQAMTGYDHVWPNESSTATFKWQINGSSGYFDELVESVSRLVKSTIDNNSMTESEWLAFNSSAINTGMNKLANYISNVVFATRESVYGSTGTYNALVTVVDVTGGKFPRLNAPIMGSGSGVGSLDETTLVLYPCRGVSTYDLGVQTDVIPSDWGVTLPQYDDEALSKILVTIAITTTIVAIAATQLKKALVKKKYAKQALRAHKLEEARDAYLDDPTNAELRKAYSNEVYRYNKLGKWFGWGTYDSANGWVDASSADDFGASQLNTSTLSDNQKLLSQIKALINGSN